MKMDFNYLSFFDLVLNNARWLVRYWVVCNYFFYLRSFLRDRLCTKKINENDDKRTQYL